MKQHGARFHMELPFCELICSLLCDANSLTIWHEMKRSDIFHDNLLKAASPQNAGKKQVINLTHTENEDLSWASPFAYIYLRGWYPTLEGSSLVHAKGVPCAGSPA